MEGWRDGDLSPDGGIWLAVRAGAALCMPAIRTLQTMSISGRPHSHTQAAQHGVFSHWASVTEPPQWLDEEHQITHRANPQFSRSADIKPVWREYSDLFMLMYPFSSLIILIRQLSYHLRQQIYHPSKRMSVIIYLIISDLSLFISEHNC